MSAGYPQYLYRLFSAEGELLYVGMSICVVQRLVKHQSAKDWWHEVRRIDIEHVPGDRADAELAELRAIRVECPRYNVAGRLRQQ